MPERAAKQTAGPQPPPAAESPPLKRKVGKTIGIVSSVVASVGTLIAAVAAIAALLISQAPAAAPPGDTSTEETSQGLPVALKVTSMSDLADAIVDFATLRLPLSESAYVSSITIAAPPFSTRVPAEWMSYEAASWEDDAGAYIGDAALVALADVESLYDESAEPGVFFAGSETTYNPAQLNAERISARLAICDDRADYVFTGDKLRDGSAIAWAGCGADDVVLVDLTANSAISGATVSVFVKLSEARDLNALRTILESLTWEEGLHVLEEEEVDASR